RCRLCCACRVSDDRAFRRRTSIGARRSHRGWRLCRAIRAERRGGLGRRRDAASDPRDPRRSDHHRRRPCDRTPGSPPTFWLALDRGRRRGYPCRGLPPPLRRFAVAGGTPDPDDVDTGDGRHESVCAMRFRSIAAPFVSLVLAMTLELGAPAMAFGTTYA